MTADQTVSLSVILVAGPSRERAQEVIDAVGRQTRVRSLELVVVDIVDDTTPPFRMPSGVRPVYIRLPETTYFSQARAEGVRRANANAVAFLEDHCVPSPTWAEALIEAHKGPWAAVGYAFAPSDRSYLARAGLMTEYGMWATPLSSGEQSHMPGNNISYKRDILIQQGDELEGLLTPDLVLHERLRRNGMSFFAEGRALVVHAELASLSSMMWANHAYARVLAHRRARSWGRLRRVAYIAGVPLGAPAIRLLRLVRVLSARRPLWIPFITSLPVIVPVYFWSALGEFMGYLFGPGDTMDTFDHWEMRAERVPLAP